jgi:hypothetical protein
MASELKQAYEKGYAPIGNVLDAELEVAETDAEPVGILDKRLEKAKAVEQRAEQACKEGSAPEAVFTRARLDRLDAEIALERAKVKLAPGK